MGEPLSAEQLAAKYPDPEFSDSIRRLLNLRTLLTESLIASDYRIHNELHSPIALSDAGQRLFENLTQKQNVPYPEARLLCFLEFWNVEILIDPIATNARALEAEIGRQIKERELRYPFSMGRLLYDKAAELTFGNGEHYLSDEETQKLLSQTPQGVFQVGIHVTGPFGLLRSTASRYIVPRQTVPFHCSDLDCTQLHHYLLSSSQEARINQNRKKAVKALQRESKTPSEWYEFLRRTNHDVAKVVYDDMRADALVFLVGDALTAEEQVVLLRRLADNGEGAVAAALGQTGKRPAELDALNQAELLQLIFVAGNEPIIRAIDDFAMSGRFDIPIGEVRAAVVNPYSYGEFSLFAELNRYGVRLQSSDLNIAPLRLRRLIDDMYDLSSPSERIELAWQIRAESEEVLEAKIDEFLRKRSPRDAVASILLARHSNLIVASEKLCVNNDLLTTDNDRVNAVLWKLGFSIADDADAHGQFWKYHDGLTNACGSNDIDTHFVDIEQVRERSVNYFLTLELILKESLVYTAWALTNDHYAARRPFVYRPESDTPFVLDLLTKHARGSYDDKSLNFSRPLTLHPLTRAFDVLAHYLRSLESRREEFARPAAEVPNWAGAQRIQMFPFMHTVPFLDLLPDSRSEIVESLERITTQLDSADVADVRNALIHPRPADVRRLRSTLETIRDTVTLLRTCGYLRQQYRPIKIDVDEAGRRTVTLADPYGLTIPVYTPSHFHWAKLPAAKSGVHVMRIARFAHPQSTLRFVTEPESPYSRLWQDYPRRQPRTGASSQKESPSSFAYQATT